MVGPALGDTIVPHGAGLLGVGVSVAAVPGDAPVRGTPEFEGAHGVRGGFVSEPNALCISDAIAYMTGDRGERPRL
jgi:hypothetical protein